MTVENQPSAAEWLAAAPAPSAPSGNSTEAAQLAADVKRVLKQAAAYAPRSQQVHLGPSELGVTCDRQVVAKLLREPVTNHVTDPWPSIVGTAVHAWLADAFDLDNRLTYSLQAPRWYTERRVTPVPGHEGTADLYDAERQELDDHKVLGNTSLNKVRSPNGPPRQYRVQLGLYALGYLRQGWPVRAINLIAYPRTQSTLDGIYVWRQPFDSGYGDLVAEALDDTRRRKAQAEAVRNGQWDLSDVPIAPDDDQCYFCPFYRPQSAHDGGAGCPGPRKGTTP